MASSKSHKPSELKPIDWERVEVDFRAGILTQQEMGAKHGCSHTAIQKHSKKHGWTRDLNAKIKAKADELVAKQEVAAATALAPELVNARASQEARATLEADTVLVNGAMLAAVRLSHRQDIARARKLAMVLFGELEGITIHPELFARLHGVLYGPGEPALDDLRDMASLVASLPGRAKVMKDLADTLHRLVGAEREAFGLDTAAGTDGRPMVIIKDYTGRGSAEAPARQQPLELPQPTPTPKWPTLDVAR